MDLDSEAFNLRDYKPAVKPFDIFISMKRMEWEVGGSLLSIGSAAGVALMGQARGCYTFFSHLKWTWAIALGYAAGIWTHFSLNAALL